MCDARARARYRFVVVGTMLASGLGTGSRYIRAQPTAAGRRELVQSGGSAHWKLRSASAAVAQGCTILGVPERVARAGEATLVELKDDDIPYLRAEIVGRPLWRVAVSQWKLDLKQGSGGVRDRYSRTFDVYLDAASGQTLRVRSRWPKGEPVMPPSVNSATATEQLRRSSRQIYHGFPSEDPEVSFLQALESIGREGWDPTVARQIVAEYVMWSEMGQEPRAVWAIMLRGVPVVKPPPGTPKTALDQYRHIIDAKTGEWIVADNLPRYCDSASEPSREGQAPGSSVVNP